MDWQLGLLSGVAAAWSPERVAEIGAGAGASAVEWLLRRDGAHLRVGALQADAGRCLQACADHGLAVCGVSVGPDLSLTSPDDVGDVITACELVGAPRARMYAPPFASDIPVTDQLADVRHALQAHADGFEVHGVALMVELSQETLIPSPELLQTVCAGLPTAAVGCVYDPPTCSVKETCIPRLR